MNLSVFFIANAEQVSELDIESSPLDRFEGFDSKGVEIVKVLTLLSLIDGSDVMANIDNMNSYFARQGDESWIVEVPRRIVDELSSANSAQLAAIAHDWTNTEEWQLDGASEEDVRWIIGEMAKLSTLATTNNQNLYLWISL